MLEYYIVVMTHVIFGALWTGASVLAGFFIIPAIAEAGPAGGAVMGGVLKRKMPLWMTGFAILTVLSGLRLFMIRFMQLGGGMDWLKSPEGLVLSLGGLLAFGAFGIGMGMQKPTADKMGALGAQIAQGGGKPSPEQAEQMGLLRAKLQKAARLQAFHLLAAVALMAAHRLATAL